LRQFFQHQDPTSITFRLWFLTMYFIIFTFVPCILILSSPIFFQMNAQLIALKNVQSYVKIYIKSAPTCFGLTTIIRELNVCTLLKLQLLNWSVKKLRRYGTSSVTWLLICSHTTELVQTVSCLMIVVRPKHVGGF
jgi:hypothetical protein